MAVYDIRDDAMFVIKSKWDIIAILFEIESDDVNKKNTFCHLDILNKGNLDANSLIVQVIAQVFFKEKTASKQAVVC